VAFFIVWSAVSKICGTLAMALSVSRILENIAKACTDTKSHLLSAIVGSNFAPRVLRMQSCGRICTQRLI
jgi:hypothetical protein